MEVKARFKSKKLLKPNAEPAKLPQMEEQPQKEQILEFDYWNTRGIRNPSAEFSAEPP